MSQIVLGWFNSGYTVIVMRRRPVALWPSRQARAFAYLESASGIHVSEESVSNERSILMLLAPHGLPTTWHKLCGHRSVSPNGSNRPTVHGSALVGEFMVAFIACIHRVANRVAGESFSSISGFADRFHVEVTDDVKGSASPPVHLSYPSSAIVICKTRGSVHAVRTEICRKLLCRVHRYLLCSANMVCLVGHIVVQTYVAEGFLAVEATSH